MPEKNETTVIVGFEEIKGPVEAEKYIQKTLEEIEDTLTMINKKYLGDKLNELGTLMTVYDLNQYRWRVDLVRERQGYKPESD